MKTSPLRPNLTPASDSPFGDRKPEACQPSSRWLSPQQRATPPVGIPPSPDPGRGSQLPRALASLQDAPIGKRIPVVSRHADVSLNHRLVSFQASGLNESTASLRLRQLRCRSASLKLKSQRSEAMELRRQARSQMEFGNEGERQVHEETRIRFALFGLITNALAVTMQLGLVFDAD